MHNQINIAVDFPNNLPNETKADRKFIERQKICKQIGYAESIFRFISSVDWDKTNPNFQDDLNDLCQLGVSMCASASDGFEHYSV